MATIHRLRFAFVASLIATTSLGAQAPRALVGLVRDSAGHGIPGAEVRARGNVVVAITNDSGRFHVAQMPVGARGVFVRRLGFAPQRAPIQTTSAGTIDSVDVVLIPVVQSLPGVAAEDPHDSLSRKVLAVSGLSIMTYRGRQEIRFRGAAIGSRNCPPQYWIDGIPLESGSAEEIS